MTIQGERYVKSKLITLLCTDVTCFSAGGSSVFQHMLAFGGRNDHLFRGGASLLSSCFHLNNVDFPPVISESAYNAIWNRLLSITNCSDIACLQALPLSTFNASVARVGSGAFNPVVDGDFIKVDPAGQVSNGEFVKVPLIVGGESACAFFNPEY